MDDFHNLPWPRQNSRCRTQSEFERNAGRPHSNRDGNLNVRNWRHHRRRAAGLRTCRVRGYPDREWSGIRCPRTGQPHILRAQNPGASADSRSACTTGLDAVQWAAQQIADGYADFALAGATDAPFAELAYATLSALGILTTYDGPPSKASRPYDLNRDGMVLGEGAAVVILEELKVPIAVEHQSMPKFSAMATGTRAGTVREPTRRKRLSPHGIRSALSMAGLTPGT